MKRKIIVWWSLVGLPIIIGAISLVIAGYSWIPQFLTGGLILIVLGFFFQIGFDEMEKKEKVTKPEKKEKKGHEQWNEQKDHQLNE